MSKIIGLAGHKGSGKSAVARILMEHDYTRLKFAGPLKAMLRCLGLTDRHIEGDLKEKPCDILGGKTPRVAMQTLGTEWGRQTISQNLWVEAWKAKAGTYDKIVADDCRFENEVRAIREVGGTVWWVERPGYRSGDEHESEQFNRAWADRTIQNDGTLKGLEITINSLLVKQNSVAAA